MYLSIPRLGWLICWANQGWNKLICSLMIRARGNQYFGIIDS